MTQSVEGSALEGQGCTTADHDPNLLGYLILAGALDSLFEGIQRDIEQCYVATSHAAEKKAGPTGTGPDLE
jgi:hypothetical protein